MSSITSPAPPSLSPNFTDTESPLFVQHRPQVECVNRDFCPERCNNVPCSTTSIYNSIYKVHNPMMNMPNVQTSANTIKLSSDIGGLTFANNIIYNKIKQQSSVKIAQGSIINANGTIVLKHDRDRDSRPFQNMTHLHRSNLHAGPKALVTLSRQCIWLINDKAIAHMIVRNCAHCVWYRPVEGKTTTAMRWQQVPEINRTFWKQWSREYLHQLQQKTKWSTQHQNVRIG